MMLTWCVGIVEKPETVMTSIPYVLVPRKQGGAESFMYVAWVTTYRRDLDVC